MCYRASLYTKFGEQGGFGLLSLHATLNDRDGLFIGVWYCSLQCGVSLCSSDAVWCWKDSSCTESSDPIRLNRTCQTFDTPSSKAG